MSHERSADYPIEPLFLNRWSPRAFDGEPIPDADLKTIFEAARWAPSAFNVQPWRFLFSHRDDAHWDGYVALLNEFNGDWAKNASALIFILSDTLISGADGEPDKVASTSSFDAGAAWAQLALQATALGYHTHAMAGIHHDEIQKNLSVPPRYRIEAAIAIGRRADPATLSEFLQEREVPSQRLSVEEIAFAGAFPSSAVPDSIVSASASS